jgi:hypothetical protein
VISLPTKWFFLLYKINQIKSRGKINEESVDLRRNVRGKVKRRKQKRRK